MDNTCLIPGEPGDPCLTCIHAETNAIAKAGSAEFDKWAFVTCSPCILCATLLINSNVAHVYYREVYRDLAGVELLQRAGLEVLEYKEFENEFRDPINLASKAIPMFRMEVGEEAK
jgi:deoxycytidylate deaminase